MIKTTFFGVAAALALCGCSILQVADSSTFNHQKLLRDGDAVAHVTGYVSGLYFFGWPVLTGDPDDPGSITWFTDNAKTKNVTKMVTAKCKALGADRVGELEVFYTSDTMFSLPYMIPYIFYIKTASASALAVKDNRHVTFFKPMNNRISDPPARNNAEKTQEIAK